jgi:hypothetical protein
VADIGCRRNAGTMCASASSARRRLRRPTCKSAATCSSWHFKPRRARLLSITDSSCQRGVDRVQQASSLAHLAAVPDQVCRSSMQGPLRQCLARPGSGSFGEKKLGSAMPLCESRKCCIRSSGAARRTKTGSTPWRLRHPWRLASQLELCFVLFPCAWGSDMCAGLISYLSLLAEQQPRMLHFNYAGYRV